MKTEDLKVKMIICPECNNAIRVAIENFMDETSKAEFANEVMKYDLQIKTINFEEYQRSKVEMYCKLDCSKFSKSGDIL